MKDIWLIIKNDKLVMSVSKKEWAEKILDIVNGDRIETCYYLTRKDMDLIYIKDL